MTFDAASVDGACRRTPPSTAIAPSVRRTSLFHPRS
jgi:hypothetical protein